MKCVSKDVSPLVYALVIIFALSSWLVVNGIWVELPLLVLVLPEGWNLPSYITACVNLANVGPIAYTVGHVFSPKTVTEKPVIYGLLTLGTIACTLLYFFWTKTSYIGGVEHSTAFLVLLFLVSIVDATSSLVFLPFMVLFKPQYVPALYIGEGLSGLLPALTALAQGLGNMECHNQTAIKNTSFASNGTWINETIQKIVPVYAPPNFAIGPFFLLLTAMAVLSGLAFIALNHLPHCKREHRNYENLEGYTARLSLNDDQDSPTIVMNKEFKKPIPSSKDQIASDANLDKEKKETLSTRTYLYLLFLVGWASCLSNAAVPSVQSFSTIPYSMSVYHWSVILSAAANPAACCVAFFVSVRSTAGLSIVTSIGTTFCAFIIGIAAVSPHPPLQYETIGAILMVFSWIMSVAFMVYAQVCLACRLRYEGRKALLWCGASSLIGASVGSLVMFLLINIYNVFQSASEC